MTSLRGLVSGATNIPRQKRRGTFQILMEKRISESSMCAIPRGPSRAHAAPEIWLRVCNLCLVCSYRVYTTKIDGVVCPSNISETVADRLMKLAHRPRIASTMIKPILLPILLILVKTIQRIVADPKRKIYYRRHLIRPTPFPVSVTVRKKRD